MTRAYISGLLSFAATIFVAGQALALETLPGEPEMDGKVEAGHEQVVPSDEPLASGRPRIVEVGARHLQGAMGWWEQPAEHTESCGFASPVRPQQTKNLAACNLETDVIHGRKIPKFLDQIFDRDNHLVGIGCRHVFQCHCGGRRTGRTLSQKEHEAILEPCACRRH